MKQTLNKTNFVLTDKTVHTFIHHVRKMMARYGSAVSQSKYTGQQSIRGLLKTFGVENRYLLPIVETCKNYWLHDNITFRPEHDTLYIHLDKDSVASIKYGTKMYITSERIVWKWQVSYISDGIGAIETLKPNPDTKKAYDTFRFNNEMSDAYWRDVEREYAMGF